MFGSFQVTKRSSKWNLIFSVSSLSLSFERISCFSLRNIGCCRFSIKLKMSHPSWARIIRNITGDLLKLMNEMRRMAWRLAPSESCHPPLYMNMLCGNNRAAYLHLNPTPFSQTKFPLYVQYSQVNSTWIISFWRSISWKPTMQCVSCQ